MNTFRATDIARLSFPFVRTAGGFNLESSDDRAGFTVKPQFDGSSIHSAGHAGDEFGRAFAGEIHIGNLYVIPNGDIRTVTNMTRSYKRAIVDIRLPYDEKLDKLLAILTDEMEKTSKDISGLSEVPQVLGILSYNPDAIIVRIVAMCSVKENWGIERELRKRVKERFDLEGIRMPHVQTTVTVES